MWGSGETACKKQAVGKAGKSHLTKYASQIRNRPVDECFLQKKAVKLKLL